MTSACMMLAVGTRHPEQLLRTEGFPIERDRPVGIVDNEMGQAVW